jgi:hypothetical protein
MARPRISLSPGVGIVNMRMKATKWFIIKEIDYLLLGMNHLKRKELLQSDAHPHHRSKGRQECFNEFNYCKITTCGIVTKQTCRMGPGFAYKVGDIIRGD